MGFGKARMYLIAAISAVLFAGCTGSETEETVGQNPRATEDADPSETAVVTPDSQPPKAANPNPSESSTATVAVEVASWEQTLKSLEQYAGKVVVIDLWATW